MSIAGNVYDNEPWVDFQQLFVVQAVSLKPQKIFHEHIAFFYKAVKNLPGVRVFHVHFQGHGQAVTGLLNPGGADLPQRPPGHRQKLSVCVPYLRPLYLDKFCPEFRQKAGGKGHGNKGSGPDDPHSPKRAELGNKIISFFHHFLRNNNMPGGLYVI